jgi:predicted metalloendopeptidase
MSVDPCEDFYEFACGGWIMQHPVPPTESHRNQFDLVLEKVDLELKGMEGKEVMERKCSNYLLLQFVCYTRKDVSPVLSLMCVCIVL